MKTPPQFLELRGCCRRSRPIQGQRKPRLNSKPINCLHPTSVRRGRTPHAANRTGTARSQDAKIPRPVTTPGSHAFDGMFFSNERSPADLVWQISSISPSRSIAMDDAGACSLPVSSASISLCHARLRLIAHLAGATKSRLGGPPGRNC